MLTLLLVTILAPFSEGQSSSCSDLHCHSINMAFRRCSLEAAIEITSVTVKVKYSASKCRDNWSYGIDSSGKSIWVEYGCRALFKVCAIYAKQSTTPDTILTTLTSSKRSAISKSTIVSQMSTTGVTVTTTTTRLPTIFYSAISTTTLKHPVTPSAFFKSITAKSLSTMFMPSAGTTSTASTGKRKSVYYSKITTILSLPMTFTLINSVRLALPVSTTINLPKPKSVSTASWTSRYPATTPTIGHISIKLASTRAYTKTAAYVPPSIKTIASSNVSRTLLYSNTPAAITTVLVSPKSIAGSATYTLVKVLPVSTTILQSSIILDFTPVSTMQPSILVSMRVTGIAVNDALNDARGSINIAFDTNFIAGAIMAGLGLLALGGTCACVLLVHVTCNRVSPTTDSK